MCLIMSARMSCLRCVYEREEFSTFKDVSLTLNTKYRGNILEDLNALNNANSFALKMSYLRPFACIFSCAIKGQKYRKHLFSSKKCSLAKLKLCFANKIFTICQKASSEKILLNFADGTDRLLKSNLSRFYSTYKMRWLSIDWKLAKVGL